MAYIDWQAVFDEQYEGLINPDSPFFEVLKKAKRPWTAFSQGRTIHMGAGRQTGKTEWILDRLVAHPTAIAIVLNLPARTELTDLLSEHIDRELARRKVFTATDIGVVGKDMLTDVVGGASHIFVDDASVNRNDRFIQHVIAQYADPSVVIVLMK